MTGPVILPVATPSRPYLHSLMTQDMLRGDLDADAGIGGHKALHLLEGLAGKVGDRLLALAAMKVSVVETAN